MADLEKVIRGWERCRKCHDVPMLFSESYRDCEYTRGMYCRQDILIEDTIALLKEQEAVKPVLDEKTGRIWLCGKCGSYVGFEDNDPHDPNEFDKYCRECGRPVLWEGR